MNELKLIKVDVSQSSHQLHQKQLSENATLKLIYQFFTSESKAKHVSYNEFV